MSTLYKIWDFPIVSVKSQLFHVPGAAFDGGYTSGGARVLSPEPGGRSVLDLELSLQVREWDIPWSSWLMSKINGEIFRIRLAKTPQLAEFKLNAENLQVKWDNNQPWDNNKGWLSETVFSISAISLEGTKTIRFNINYSNQIFKNGHVLGIGDNCYIIEEIEYSTDGFAIALISPPLRKTITIDDCITTIPNFIGAISNGSEIKSNYDKSNNGSIKLNTIVFQEVII